jgi:hypothetical protein
VGKFLSNYATGGFLRRAQLHGVSSVCFEVLTAVVMKRALKIEAICSSETWRYIPKDRELHFELYQQKHVYGTALITVLCLQCRGSFCVGEFCVVNYYFRHHTSHQWDASRRLRNTGLEAGGDATRDVRHEPQEFPITTDRRHNRSGQT